MASEGHAPTSGEYITHHLQHWQKNFAFEDVKQTSIIDFSVFNFDSLIYSSVLGLLAVFLLWRAARKAHSGVPGRFQAAVEILVEMVDNQAKSVIHNEKSRKLIGPVALTVFVWIFFMNFMDMLPVDWLPSLFSNYIAHDPQHAYQRVVPTADLSTTLSMSTFVLVLVFFYSVKIKGLGGWGHELISAPFGAHPVLWPFNFAMQVIEFVAKTVSHGMRLFGNMFAGELVFMLIALMGGGWALTGTGIGLVICQRLVALMGGTLRVSSTEGHGSTFFFDLPAAHPPHAGPALTPDTLTETDAMPSSTTMSGPAPYDTRKVLYVEDNLANRDIMAAMLGLRPQIDVHHEMTVHAGMERLDTEGFDLVLLDMHLPDGSGLDLLAWMKRHEELREVPVVVVSADVTAATMAKARAAGALAYLQKPLDLPLVLEVVDAILAKGALPAKAIP